MFSVPINIEMFWIRHCEILSMVFVLAEYKYVIFWLRVRFRRSESTCDKDLTLTRRIESPESSFEWKYHTFTFYNDEKYTWNFAGMDSKHFDIYKDKKNILALLNKGDGSYYFFLFFLFFFHSHFPFILLRSCSMMSSW